ncbi:MAG: hypothetical protein WCS73_02490 [Lentisphaeria bacterium]
MAMGNLFGKSHRDDDFDQVAPSAPMGLPAQQQENLDQDVSYLENEDTSHRIQKVADKEVKSAAEDSLKKMYVVQRGRCPNCGGHLYKHMSASICESCGWHRYDMPKKGSVRVHLHNNSGVVNGKYAYVLTSGECLVVDEDVVKAKIPKNCYDWVEYLWTEDEIEQHREQGITNLQLRSGEIHCGWCNKIADPSKDGFHLVHVAFGTSQERYCFCSDDCYEAFRKMYPARVHRNCYERDCSTCNLCLKRYTDEVSEIRMLAKDFLKKNK